MRTKAILSLSSRRGLVRELQNAIKQFNAEFDEEQRRGNTQREATFATHLAASRTGPDRPPAHFT